jgi:hypothetical protein
MKLFPLEKKYLNVLVAFGGVVFSLAMAFFFFYGEEKRDAIFFIHDSQQYSSIHDVYNRIFTLYNLNSDSLGKIPNVAPMMNIINGLFFSPLFLFDVPSGYINLLFYFVVQILILAFSFFGFKSIYKYIILQDKNSLSDRDHFSIFSVTIFYFFSPYNILNINTGIFFSLTYVSYGLIPFFVFYLLRAVKGEISLFQTMLWALICTWISFQATFVIPAIIFSVPFIILLKKENIINFLFKIALVVFLVFLLTLPATLPPAMHSLEKDFAESILAGSAQDRIQGGIITVFKSHFSWVIYNIWEPRSVLSFHEYLNSFAFITTSIAVYIFIFFRYFFQYSQKNKEHFVLISSLLLMIFFSKGNNAPFGDLFSFFVDHFSLFSPVRTPDNKFSAFIPVALSILLLIILSPKEKYRRKYNMTIGFLFVVTLVFSWPLFSKEAVLSRDEYPKSGNYFLNAPNEYRDFVNIINSDPEAYNIVSIPRYNGILDHQHKMFIGRDILSTLIDKPFIYYSNDDQSFFQRIVKTERLENFGSLNAKYILLRKDLYPEEQGKDTGQNQVHIIAGLEKNIYLKKIIDNNYLSLYEIQKDLFQEKISISGGKIIFYRNNITKYRISISDVKSPETINFVEAYNKNYALYPERLNSKMDSCHVSLIINGLCSILNDAQYFFMKPIDDVFHYTNTSGFNSWTIDPEYIKENFSKDQYHENPDGSIDLELTLYFKPQSYFYLGLIISGATLVACLGYLGYVGIRSWRKRGKTDDFQV